MLVAFGATIGRADVYEIDDLGAVHVRPQTGVVQWVEPDTDRNTVDDPLLAAKVPSTALTEIATPDVPDAWRAALLSSADRYRLSPDLLSALIWQESRWHAAALSPKGARGLAQLMPGTARALAVDASDPAANLAGGALYLRQMLDRFDGDVERALAAYNAGPERVQRAGGVPAFTETRAYVADIFHRLTPAQAGETGLLK